MGKDHDKFPTLGAAINRAELTSGPCVIVECPENGGYGGPPMYHVENNASPFLRTFERVVWKNGKLTVPRESCYGF